jgi:hypothetical protein
MAEQVVVELRALTDTAVADVEKLTNSIQQTKEASSDTNKTIDEGTNIVDKYTNGAVSGFKKFTSTIRTAIKSFGVLKLAIAATGLGALVLVVTSIQQAFVRSEEGQDRFARLLGQISAVTGELLDRLANLGMAIVDAFTNPGQALSDFGNTIKQFVLDRIKLTLEGIGLLGTAITKVFKGDFKGAAKDAGAGFMTLNKGINPAVIATDLLVKSTTKLVKVTKEATKAALEEAKIAGEIADLRAKADKVDRQLLVDRAEADRDRAELLEKAIDKEKFSLQERIGFLEEAGKLEEEITNKEIAAVQMRLDAAKKQAELGLADKAELEEEKRLEAELIQLETAKLTKQREVTSQKIALKAEEAAAEKVIEDEKDAAEKEREDKKVTEKEERDARILAGQQKTDALITQSKAKAVDAAISLFGAETAAGKAALIAKQLLAVQEMVAEAKKTITFSSLVASRSAASVAAGTAETAKIGFPQNIPMLIGYALQAAGIIKAISSAVSKSKSVASSLGGGGGASTTIAAPPTPPAFNIVGAGGANQLAETIAGQTQRPVKAFVTSQDVTTAQSLERNIVEGASI